MAWFDLDEDYYTKNLPADLLKVRRLLFDNNRDFTGIELCHDLQSAEKVLEWSNREGNTFTKFDRSGRQHCSSTDFTTY